jgi:hypothetical protein
MDNIQNNFVYFDEFLCAEMRLQINKTKFE